MSKLSNLFGGIKVRTNKRSYIELLSIPTFKERYEYLRLNGQVGIETFGFDRWLNQRFYSSIEWQQLRNKIILRDEACDLAFPGMPCFGRMVIHHMNPISQEKLVGRDESVLDPENLILCSLQTHNAIHYGDSSKLREDFIERRPNDTCPWR